VAHESWPSTARGQSTRAEIVHAAYQLTAEKGLSALHTRAVAKLAGVNVATLHYYFPTKHDLQVALLRWVLTQFESRPPRKPQSLAEELRETVSWLAIEPELIALWHDFWNLGRTDPEVRQLLHDHLTRWRAHLARLLHQPPDSIYATSLLALALGLPLVAGALPQSWTPDTIAQAVQTWLAHAGAPDKAPERSR
jgi:AcrR family transcriptional regulator